MKKTTAVLLGFVLLTACSSEPAPVGKFSLAPSPRIVLDVASVEVIDHSEFQPSDSPYNSHRLEPTIAQAVRQWVANTIQAGGTQGQAVVVIKDASLSAQALPISSDLTDRWFKRQQASKYTGHADVQVEITGRDSYALASAEATRAITLPEAPTEAERQDDYFTLLNGLMRDLGQNLDGGIREHMHGFIMPNPRNFQ